MAERAPQRSILAHMAARPAEPPPAALSPTRALRIALTRAAESAAGLGLTALGAGDEDSPLADLVARVGDDWLLLRLDGPTGPGIAALDPALMLAVVENRTCGRLAEREPDSREPTAADAALAEPVVAGFLAELATLAAGTTLEDWPGTCTIGPRLADRRALGLVLAETVFRVVSVSCWLGVGERQGSFLLALPLAPAPPDDGRAQRAARWGQALAQSVLMAEMPLDTVLHRMRMPLSTLAALTPGQLLPLPGARVTGVRLETPGGSCLGSGRLGQSAGMRALRIEPAPAPQLVTDDADPAAAAPPPQALDPPDSEQTDSGQADSD